MRQTIRYMLIAALTLLPAYGYLTAVPSTIHDLTPPDETKPMSSETSATPSEANAEQVLRRLLELIRMSHSIAEFTPTRLNDVMKVSINRWENDYGSGGKLTDQWSYGFQMQQVRVARKDRRWRFEFSFNPTTGNSSPDMANVCQMDFDQFTSQLEAMGYAREHYYDSAPPPAMREARLPHGRLIYDAFRGQGLYIQVYPRGEGLEPIERINHRCIKMLLID